MVLISSKNILKANHNSIENWEQLVELVLISSKNILKANHNHYFELEIENLIGFNILKEHIESKSQLFPTTDRFVQDWF